MWKIILIAWAVYALAFNLALIRKAPRPKKTPPASRGWGNRGRVLIIGATGGTGRQLVEQALEQGHQVTAFVRKPEKLKIEHANLRVAAGNVLDYATVESAMQGQNAVVCALGHKRFFYPNRILSDGTRNILRAMKNCRVPRFICESSLGVGSAVGRLGLPATFFTVPLILPFYLWDRVRQEQLIEESDVDWIVVRPGILTNGAARGSYQHGPSVGSYLRPKRISRADVADFMLKQLNDDTYTGRAPGICY
jgi:nucleoside-diphosphate-sugar epimerase